MLPSCVWMKQGGKKVLWERLNPKPLLDVTWFPSYSGVTEAYCCNFRLNSWQVQIKVIFQTLYVCPCLSQRSPAGRFILWWSFLCAPLRSCGEISCIPCLATVACDRLVILKLAQMTFYPEYCTSLNGTCGEKISLFLLLEVSTYSWSSRCTMWGVPCGVLTKTRYYISLLMQLAFKCILSAINFYILLMHCQYINN